MAVLKPYVGLNRAQLSYDYLHTNSTTHEFLFGALVELVDNSRDAGAKKINIFSEPDSRFTGGQLLYFLDDGCGMDQTEASGVMNFGFSAKKFDPAMIGQYGNGLKSGAMRIGKDFLLFTKRSNILTSVFLSRSFHEKEHISEVIVPMPSFTADNKTPVAETVEDHERWKQEMELIQNYSPFKTERELLAQFDKIKGPSGTMVVVFNLRLLDTGDPELDFASDNRDIRLGDPDGRDLEMVPERMSLRAYLAVIYKEPHMKIYIQNKKVQTRRILSSLYKPRQYKFMSKNFKSRAEKEVAKAKEDAKLAMQRQKEMESKLGDFENRHTNKTDYLTRVERRQLNDAVALAKKQAADANKRAKEKEKSKNDPKPLLYVYGLNLERRGHCGCMIYNNGRLIKMYEKVGPQIEGGIKGLGVIAVVDVPYIVLEPTHNKQDFADGREYRSLLKSLGDHMDQYWKDLDIASQSGGVPQFWQMYGYGSKDWSAAPSNDKEFMQRRMMSVHQCVQCDECLKWRTVPFKAIYIGKEFPENWTCRDNPNTQFQSCSVSEHFDRIPEGKLQKSLEDTDLKRARVEKQLAQKQKELEKLDKTPVTSSREARKLESQRAASSPQKRGQSRRRSPSPPPRAKTKADLRKQDEQKKLAEKAKKEQEKKKEAERKRKEDEKRRKEKEEEQKRKEKEKTRAAAEKRRLKAVVVEESEESGEETPPQPEKTPSGSSTRSARRRASSPPAEPVDTKRARPAEPVRAVAQSSAQGGGSAEVSSTAGGANDKLQSLTEKFRDMIKYLLPPGWHLNKGQVAELSVDELINIDLRGDFYPTYEQNLRNLMNKQQELSTKELDKAKQEKVDLENKLKSVRRNAATLLENINPGCVSPDEKESDKVDAKLQDCVAELRNMSA